MRKSRNVETSTRQRWWKKNSLFLLPSLIFLTAAIVLGVCLFTSPLSLPVGLAALTTLMITGGEVAAILSLVCFALLSAAAITIPSYFFYHNKKVDNSPLAFKSIKKPEPDMIGAPAVLSPTKIRITSVLDPSQQSISASTTSISTKTTTPANSLSTAAPVQRHAIEHSAGNEFRLMGRKKSPHPRRKSKNPWGNNTPSKPAANVTVDCSNQQTATSDNHACSFINPTPA